jgi:hypothetical protein
MTGPRGEALSREGKGTEATTPTGRDHPIAWDEVTRRFAEGGWFWLSTVRPEGAPHTRPVFAAWAGSTFFVASKDTARKSRNLAANAHCSLGRDTGDLHVVVEGTARRVTDTGSLERAVAAFADVYGWPTTVVGDQLDAPYGAPTSGGPPYDVYEVQPVTAFAFPADGESVTPTRWRF